MLWGFEAACRVGMAVGPAHYRIWHNTATCGPFGAAMAAARLVGLDGGATVHALGNAGSQSSGLWQFLETGAMTKHLHAGRAAEAGVLAADLARLGFTGPPAILEGQKGFFRATCADADPSRVTADPDAPWQLHLTSIKPYPSCRHTHPAIDAARALAAAIATAGHVVDVEVVTYQAALDVCDRPHPTTDYEAKFSLQHAVAVALAPGQVDFASFGAAARERMAALRDTVRLRLGQPYASAYPAAWGSAVTVRLADGRTLAAARDHALGDPEAPLAHDDLVAKAVMLFRHGGRNDAERLAESLLALAHADAEGTLPDLALG